MASDSIASDSTASLVAPLSEQQPGPGAAPISPQHIKNCQLMAHEIASVWLKYVKIALKDRERINVLYIRVKIDSTGVLAMTSPEDLMKRAFCTLGDLDTTEFEPEDESVSTREEQRLAWKIKVQNSANAALQALKTVKQELTDIFIKPDFANISEINIKCDLTGDEIMYTLDVSSDIDP